MLSGDTPIGTTEYPSRTQVETSGVASFTATARSSSYGAISVPASRSGSEECEDLPGRELGLGIAS